MALVMRVVPCTTTRASLVWRAHASAIWSARLSDGILVSVAEPSPSTATMSVNVPPVSMPTRCSVAIVIGPT
jgi:hypothetical protein